MLLKKGWDPNHKDVWENTPYHIASMEPNLEIFKLFEEYNGDASIKNKDEETVLEKIFQHKDAKINEYFLNLKKYSSFINKL